MSSKIESNMNIVYAFVGGHDEIQNNFPIERKTNQVY